MISIQFVPSPGLWTLQNEDFLYNADDVKDDVMTTEFLKGAAVQPCDLAIYFDIAQNMCFQRKNAKLYSVTSFGYLFIAFYVFYFILLFILFAQKFQTETFGCAK